MVSGTISLPSRGTFHHSLTVLSTIGHTVFRLTGWSRQIHNRFHEPVATREPNNPHIIIFSYRTLTYSGRSFQTTSPNNNAQGVPLVDDTQLSPTTPHTQPLPGITCTRFSLIHVRSPLLAESLLFSPPTGTEMFHFPA